LDFCKKQDTRAILLKIALFCVSCIQNTQIREEITAKVFGKVDTFWTYHEVVGERSEQRWMLEEEN
jgi:hypothetical protein